MALRMIEVVLDKGNVENVKDAVREFDLEDIWFIEGEEGRLTIKMLVLAEDSEEIIDILSKRFSVFENFRIVLMAVEATLPAMEERPASKEEGNGERKWINRISREELQDDVGQTAKLNLVYIIAIVLSVTVAAIGLMKDNVAVVIGAMVIAPLLGPNMALSLSTILADVKLAKMALWTLFIGIVVALILSIGIGLILNIDPTVPEIASRTKIDLSDIVLALASGTAGALFFSIGVSTALVGVMAAVALLPPLVALGLLIGSGHGDLAFNTLLLFFTNFICVNLSGVAVFGAQGIKPSSWWQTILAKKSTAWALLVWLSLLIVMIFVVLWFST